jgi:hypothetical protein
MVLPARAFHEIYTSSRRRNLVSSGRLDIAEPDDRKIGEATFTSFHIAVHNIYTVGRRAGVMLPFAQKRDIIEEDL